jgi:hypothetical protein
MQGEAIGSAQPGNSAEVAVGVQQVHRFLLSQLRSLVDDAVRDRCQFELAHSPQVLFGRQAVSQVLNLLGCGSAPGCLGLFGPMLRQVMLTQLTPGKALTIQPLLVPAVLATLKRTYVVQHVLAALQKVSTPAGVASDRWRRCLIPVCDHCDVHLTPYNGRPPITERCSPSVAAACM